MLGVARVTGRVYYRQGPVGLGEECVRYTQRMGFLLLVEFLAATWGGAYVAMLKVPDSTFWAIFGWFAGAVVFGFACEWLMGLNAVVIS